jgi:hypothetical protein
MIPWRPIAELPDELKDGRQVLVCEQYDDGSWRADTCRWGDALGWRDGGDQEFDEPTHFAEITPP